MKALTIYQPWASLIMAGAKPYEFRKWAAHRTIIGQRIVIHASARKIKESEIYKILRSLHEGGAEAAMTCLHPAKAMPILKRALAKEVNGEFRCRSLDGHGDLPWSAGIGTAILGEPRNGFDGAEEFGFARVNDSDRDEHANWGWPLTDIEVWDQPIPMRGMQGFWTWPELQDLCL